MFSQEIEYSETDGFARNKLLFHKSTDTPLVTNIKPVRGTRFADSTAYSVFKEVFLPQGFPQSVHRDYVPYQIWDTLQAFASTINGNLTTHSIMRGVGVGESTATPIAAAITWILKDGTGMIGRIMFAWWQGNNLGSHCKKWRLFADILNDLSLTIEVTIPYISIYYTSHCLCLTTGMKAIVGIAGGATRTAITQHHAINDNLADVHAKEYSQGTLVNLAGSIVGIIILLCVNERFFLPLCILLVIIHLISNYFAVTSLQINTLNDDRLCLVIEEYLLYHTVTGVDEINKRESVSIFQDNPAKKIFGFDIECGACLDQLVKMKIVNPRDIKYLLALFDRRKYLPIMNLKKRKIYIILSKKVTDDDILKAYFHSCIYALIISRLKKFPTETLQNLNLSGPSYPIMRILQFPDKYSAILSESDLYVSSEIVSAVDQLVFEESYMFFKQLNNSEWVMKANMLSILPWRGAWK